MATETLTTGAAQPMGDLRIEFYYYGTGCSVYVEGTRAQLTDAGLVPAFVQWPVGSRDVWWTGGVNKFRLSRYRPDGMKGPQHLWLEGDNWRLRVDPASPPRPGDVAILRAFAELRRLIHFYSPTGQAESSERYSRAREAARDLAFQAFKAKVLPPVQRRRQAKAN